MCIAVYKPIGETFPNKKVLKECFSSDPDGAGFMVADGDKVHIEKGFMGFKSFWRALRDARKKYGDNRAYVMHFRISTQAGVNKECTHPFPLSSNMSDLKKLKFDTDIGVAHNGIIDLTSSYRKGITHSDTMEFITDYLSLIIEGYDYHKNANTVMLIDRLCGSRLAILDRFGHCELIGDWIHDDGIWYSNTSYIPTRYSYGSYSGGLYGGWNSYLDDGYAYDEYWDSYDKLVDKYSYAYDKNTGLYDIDMNDCPYLNYGDASMCYNCSRYDYCWGFGCK